MRIWKIGPIAIMLMSVLVLAGCPLFNPGNRVFTSADTGQGGNFDGNGAEADGGGESPALDEDRDQRDVVEPDVIRRQDNLLYVLNQYRGLTIVDLDAQALLAQVPTLGYPRDLYFSGGQAYVLVAYAQDVSIQADTVSVAAETRTRLYAVDVTDPAQAAIESSLDLPGDLVDSRLVGDVLYAVCAEYDYHYGFAEDLAWGSNFATTTVTSVDLSNPDALATADTATFEGSGTVIHVTPEFAFVATPDWQHDATVITCLDISDPAGAIQTAGVVSVRGYVDDKFKMDAWEGALRVVSSSWQEGRQVYLTTFDLTKPSLPLLAELRLEGAEGETLFATRFDGPRAYIVTFLVVDPLFVVDVADPAAPQLLGALEVPGYSTYIEARGDRLIALGVDNTDGQKISVSIFDVSGNGAPTLADRVSFGEDWAWSSAYGDVKALTILDDVIIVPFSGWGGYSGGYERLQFISYAEDALQLRGAVDLSGSILRSFDYDGFYYGVTTEQVTRIDGADLDNPTVASSITIAENVVDYHEINADLAVELVERYDEAQIVVRTKNSAGDTQGELVLETGTYFGAYPSGDSLAVVGIVWDESPAYQVAIVDLTDPAIPALRDSVAVNVNPYYGYYYYDYGFGGPEPGGVDDPRGEPGVAVDAAQDIAIGYPYYNNYGGEGAFLLGDTLVLRCYTNRFDQTFGTGTAYHGVALVDLAAGEWTDTIGLAYDYLVSLDAVGDTLFASTKESADSLPFQRPMASYYVRELDVLNGVEGPAANVPGAFVQYDPASDVLTLHDHQWSFNGDVQSSLETVRWSGGATVTPLDSAAIPGYAGRVLGVGSQVYFDSYSDTYQIQQARIDGNGAIVLGTPVETGGYYGNIIGAQGDDLFATIEYGAIAHYNFSEGTGERVSLTPATGYPSKIRFGGFNAYFPLGYYGLLTLPL